MPFNPGDGNTAEYRALEGGWHRFVRSGTHPAVYWDPTDKRWENYPKEDFGVSRTALAPIALGNRVDLPFLILQEV